MKTEKLLSIIIPVYNGEQFLEETLRSILGGSYQNIEVIIVDDGSTDQSEAVYLRYAEADHRFQVIKQENQGIVGARNAGLKAANGEFLVFCDQDDRVGEQFYEFAITKMEKDKSQMCICSTARFYDKKSVAYEQHMDGVYTGDEIINELLFPSLFANFRFERTSHVKGKMTLWNCVFRKELFDCNELVFKKNVNYEDDLIMRFEALIVADRVSTLEYCGYFWRTNLYSESHRVKYIEEIAKKQEATRNELKKLLLRNNRDAFVLTYDNYQKIPDCIKILENEMFHKVPYKEKRRVITATMPTVISERTKAYSYKLGKGEIRYRMVWFWLRRDNYMSAYWVNTFLYKAIRALDCLKVANTVEKLLKG